MKKLKFKTVECHKCDWNLGRYKERKWKYTKCPKCGCEKLIHGEREKSYSDELLDRGTEMHIDRNWGFDSLKRIIVNTKSPGRRSKTR